MKNQFWRWPWQKPQTPIRPPKVGGTRAPDSICAIDFTKPHDFHFSLGYGAHCEVVLRNCLLVGFTTPMGDGNDQETYGEYAHNRWLVLQREDGRLVYVPRDGLLYIEESCPESNDPPKDS
jgi:hypothetical protein